jgi:hypothetical protein
MAVLDWGTAQPLEPWGTGYYFGINNKTVRVLRSLIILDMKVKKSSV